MTYLRTYCLVVLAVLGLASGFTVLIDPFDLWGTPRIHGFNDVKAPGNHRFYKPLQVSVRRPATVFLGNSRVQMSIDPADFPELNAYNFAVPGALISEELLFARHALAEAPIREMVVGVDFISFNDDKHMDESLNLQNLGRFFFWRSLPRVLFSREAMLRSRYTLRASRKHHQDIHKSNGFRIYPSIDREKPREAVLDDLHDYYVIYHSINKIEKSLQQFTVLLDEAKAKGVKITVFNPAFHAAIFESIEFVGKTELYEEWLTKVVLLCAERGIPFWDFSGYNRYTMVPLDDTFSTYFDSSHIQPWVGRKELLTMVNRASEDGFGTQLTPAMMPAYLADRAAARQRWLTEYRDDVRAIRDALAR